MSTVADMGQTRYTRRVGQKRQIMIEIDGPSAEPHEIETGAALEFLASYVSLLEHSAAAVNERLTLSGVEIINKCTALRFSVSSVTVAMNAARRARPWIRDPSAAPRGATAAARRANQARLAMRRGLEVSVRSATSTQAPLVVDASISTACVTTEHTEIRATVVRAGGDDRPTIDLRVEPEGRIAHFAVSKETARTLGGHLYSLIDAVVEIERDEDLLPIRGRILDYEMVDSVMSSEDQISRFMTWLSSDGYDKKLDS